MTSDGAAHLINYGEGYGEREIASSDSLCPGDISWQHFPRSTSSRSRCDDSTISIKTKKKKSVPSSAVTDAIENEKSGTSVSSTEYPITKTRSQLDAQHYLQIRHVYEFFNFLIGHLVCHEPDDPVRFLVELLDRCVASRDEQADPPLLFTSDHVDSMYTAFDPFGRGDISPDQYDEAMRTLGIANGITPYDRDPPSNDRGFVDETTFKDEAMRCLKRNFKRMVRIPKKWEENRLVWKKRMQKRETAKPVDTIKYAEEMGEYEEISRCGEEEDEYCSCPENVKKNVKGCECPQDLIRPEPEQLFLHV